MKVVLSLVCMMIPVVGMALDMTEKVDDFDRTTTLACTTESPKFVGELLLSARAEWDTGKPDSVRYWLAFHQFGREWEWMKYHATKMLVNDDSLALSEETFHSDIQENGLLHEMVLLRLNNEQMIRVLKAKTVRLKVGANEYRWTPAQTEAMRTVFDGWQARGGSLAEYQDLIQTLSKPSEKEQRAAMQAGAEAAMKGRPLADIEATHGKALSMDAKSGWATWARFKARFVGGRVAEVELR